MAELMRYQTNGALLPGSPTYIRRSADDEIWDILSHDEFCFVLAPRQMGKSSLLWHTVERLRESGVFVITANLQGMGDGITEAEFYEGIIDRLVDDAAKNRGFQIPFDWSVWWDQQRGPLSQRFVKLILEAFLKSTESAQHWVIAFDEIDATISLPFTDSFFTAIRSCHDLRPGDPLFRRLSFILLGVATPDALIKDRTRTPFNVGRQVDLRPFSDEEALPLASGLPLNDELKPHALKCVMAWTHGQPHLTQDACDALAKHWRKGTVPQTMEQVASEVESLIAERYLNSLTRGGNAHFDYIEKRRVARFPAKTSLLRTYINTLKATGVPDNRESGVAAELKISGLVVRNKQGMLKVANPIYATIFNEQWARDNMPRNWPVIRSLAAGVLAVLLLLLSEYGYRRPEAIATQLAEASGDLELARKNYGSLRGYPFYNSRADSLWGEFHLRRFQQAIALDADAIRTASPERQQEALLLADSARKELSDCPGARWKQASTDLWQEFHRHRLTAAIDLDANSSAALDKFDPQIMETTPGERRLVPNELVTLQNSQRNAFQVATQANAAVQQEEALAEFYNRRADRAEMHEDLNASLLWRMSSLNVLNAPKNRRALTHLIGPDYDSLVRTWGTTIKDPGRANILACQMIKNSSQLVIASETVIQVFNLLTGETVGQIRPPSSIASVAISSDESRILACSYDGRIRVWEFDQANHIATVTHETEKEPSKSQNVSLSEPGLFAARFSRDGQHFVSWSGTSDIKVWNVNSQEPIQTFKHENNVIGALFSSDEKRILTWSFDNTARLWDVNSPEPVQTFKHENTVRGAIFGSDQKRVLTWGFDNTARLWDVNSPEPLQTFKHDNWVNGALFSSDEKRVLTWSNDNTARLWDVNSPEPLQTFKQDGLVRGALFSSDEKCILTWSNDNTARLWDVNRAEPLRVFEHDGGVQGTLFSSDEHRILTWSNDNTAKLWDVDTTEPIQTFRHDQWVIGAIFSNDEQRVLTWSADNTARFWDVNRTEPAQTFKHDRWVIGATFSRDEKRFLTWSADNTARLWDVNKTEPIQTFKHDASMIGARFSSDEKHFLTWSNDNTARFWDINTTEPIRTFRHDDCVNGARFSSDERRILTWSDDNTARLWDINMTEPIRTFRHEASVSGSLFSSDERRILTWSNDNTARLWDANKTEPIQTFKHDQWVIGAMFSRDEKRILTWSADNTARLWDVSSSELIQTFKHDGWISGPRFSSDEKRFLTWSNDNTATLWDVSRTEAVKTIRFGNTIRLAEFTEDGSGLLAMTTDWIHRTSLTDGKTMISRRTNGGLLNDPKWQTTKGPFCIICRWPGAGSVTCEQLQWSDYAETEIKGIPAELMNAWSDKLGVKISQSGDIDPLRPISLPR